MSIQGGFGRGALKPCLGAAVLALTFGCGPRGGGGGGFAQTAEQAAAESLTNALSFQNEGAKQIDGPFPAELSTDVTKEVEMGPGGSGAISVDETSADDPVVATLVWMNGSSKFWSLPAGGASRGGGQVQNTFTVTGDVCDDLCNIIHQVKCYEAAQTASGTVTQANLTQVILQCEEEGSETKCSSSGSTVAPPPPPPGDNPSNPPPEGTYSCSGLCFAAAKVAGACGPELVPNCEAVCQSFDQECLGPVTDALNCLASDCDNSACTAGLPANCGQRGR